MANWKYWADRLILEGELDPLYNALKGAIPVMGMPWVSRFCLSMVMFYDIGEAYTMASLEGKAFWEYIRNNWGSMKRGEESRHFRGTAGYKAVESLKTWGVPPDEVLYMPFAQYYTRFHKNVREQTFGFGDYKILKWGDFLVNVFGFPMIYANLHKHLPEGSLQGLRFILPGDPERALMHVRDYIEQYEVPWGGRQCGLSEAETVGCGYKVYGLGTRYKFGYDIHHYRLAFQNIGTPEARALSGMLPIETPEWRK